LVELARKVDAGRDAGVPADARAAHGNENLSIGDATNRDFVPRREACGPHYVDRKRDLVL